MSAEVSISTEAFACQRDEAMTVHHPFKR